MPLLDAGSRDRRREVREQAEVQVKYAGLPRAPAAGDRQGQPARANRCCRKISTMREVRGLSNEVRQKLISALSPGDHRPGQPDFGNYAGGHFTAAGAFETRSKYQAPRTA